MRFPVVCFTRGDFTQYSNQGLKADNFSQNVDYETLNNTLLYFHLKIYMIPLS